MNLPHARILLSSLVALVTSELTCHVPRGASSLMEAVQKKDSARRVAQRKFRAKWKPQERRWQTAVRLAMMESGCWQ